MPSPKKAASRFYGIYFDTDKADIKPESAPTLAEMAKFLTEASDLAVVVVGHTDNQGAMDYNLDLSHRRAQAVADALVSGYGIAKDRLTAAGAGFLAPVAPNDNESGRAKNRRVEMIRAKLSATANPAIDQALIRRFAGRGLRFGFSSRARSATRNAVSAQSRNSSGSS